MHCEKCGKRVTGEDIKFSPLSEYARHKRCGGKIVKDAIFTSGSRQVFI